MIERNVRIGLGLIALSIVTLAYAEKSDPPKVSAPDEMFAEVSPALRAEGQKHGMRLDGRARLRDGPPKPGDAIVVLATYFEGGQQKQWLVQIEVDASEAEPGGQTGGGMTLHTTTGRTFHFSFAWLALKLLTVGPVVPGDRGPQEPAVQHALVRLNGDYLALGVHRANELFDVERAAGEAINYNVGGAPFDEKTIAEGKKIAERTGLSEASERAFAGTIPALLEFFEVVRNTPGVRDILFQVLEKPSPWSLLKVAVKRSMNVGFFFSSEGSGIVESGAWHLGESQVRAVPMTLSLFERPALQFTMFATEPKPPLRASAGIIGLKAAAPKHPERFVVLRVIASSEGGDK